MAIIMAACRPAGAIVEELGCELFGGKNWAAPSLDRLSSDRRDMSKHEREGAMLATLRHYTHQAHHIQSEGGEPSYSRADAQHILALAASFVAHAMSGR